MPNPIAVPAAHQTFVLRALALLKEDIRVVGVAAAGSWISDTMDEHSDVDLVIVTLKESLEDVMADRIGLAERMGNLLAAFTGETWASLAC